MRSSVLALDSDACLGNPSHVSGESRQDSSACLDDPSDYDFQAQGLSQVEQKLIMAAEALPQNHQHVHHLILLMSQILLTLGSRSEGLMRCIQYRSIC